MRIERFADSAALAVGAAQRIVEWIGAAVATRGRCSIALAGGSTPKRLYEVLATPQWAQRIKWEHVHVFWGDERCVGPHDPRSNFRVAHEALLSKIPIPPHNVHRIRGEIAPRDAATEYDTQLREFLGERATAASPTEGASLDIVLLGMGDDGHTASLFPDTEAMRKELRGDQDRWVVANYIEPLETWRVTLTTIPINGARNVLFLVSGARKARILERVVAGSASRDLLPVDLIRPVSGQLTWLIDEDAAQHIPTR